MTEGKGQFIRDVTLVVYLTVFWSWFRSQNWESPTRTVIMLTFRYESGLGNPAVKEVEWILIHLNRNKCRRLPYSSSLG